MSDPQPGFSTRQVHVGEDVASATPRATPIHLTAGFTFDSFQQGVDHFGAGVGFGYTRIGNPTTDAVERKLASLDGGTSALLVASGQAAVTGAILSSAGAGDHIVVSDHIYEGSRGLFLDVLARFGIETSFVSDIRNAQAWRNAIRPNTKVLFGETISNAANRLLDVRQVADIAEEHGIPLIVDSTFSTAYLQRPLEDGAALVVHSTSKFISGQGAVIGGVIIDGGHFDPARDGARAPHLVAPGAHGDASAAEKHGGSARLGWARDVLVPRLGPSLSPLNAFFIGQGLETLSLRVREHSRNAAVVAAWLEAQPAVASVDYVGLPSHPDHDLVERLLPRGAGSVFTFTLHGGRAAAEHVIESVQTFTHMTHLGDVRSLILHPATTSHVHATPDRRADVGVHEGTLRVSIGIEDVDDLIADLDRAFAGLPTEAVTA
ncbi:O-acetylhomoserine aminocarboxypropyltransferase/cysteine synthase family protein [Microbacterium gorillae]|uniref:O-acetylhomoserine aminocarboxypropyltransferase/cysteine synthase family protein n=1 Tax=Microbacterium gorillae TaxID=1231063 RepID=UPI00058C1B42|nr:aminotransferase class I/II-fold pyridoxal phosphate-dependent enzyme [Microbacterium gorillae]